MIDWENLRSKLAIPEQRLLFIGALEQETHLRWSSTDFSAFLHDLFQTSQPAGSPSYLLWEKAYARYLTFAARMENGEPLQYILGEQCFFGYFFQVGPGVLIPRPETEILVEVALATLRQHCPGDTNGIEIGLGSGNIAITLALEIPDVRIWGSEVNPNSFSYFEKNKTSLLTPAQQDRVTGFLVEERSDILEPFCALPPFDWIISNPPYLLEHEAESVVQNTEPHLALFVKDARDPLFYYRSILEQSPRVLKENGTVFFEIPHERAASILHLGRDLGFEVELISDLTGRPRVAICKRNPHLWTNSKFRAEKN